jgi:putative oxidoreductase
MLTVHRNAGFFAMTNGVELPLLYTAGAVALALTGPGRFSLDALLGLGWLSTPAIALTMLVVGAFGALGTLAVRRMPKVVPAN